MAICKDCGDEYTPENKERYCAKCRHKYGKYLNLSGLKTPRNPDLERPKTDVSRKLRDGYEMIDPFENDDYYRNNEDD